MFITTYLNSRVMLSETTNHDGHHDGPHNDWFSLHSEIGGRVESA